MTSILWVLIGVAIGTGSLSYLIASRLSDRNDLVCAYRLALIRAIAEAAEKDTGPYLWRYEEFCRVSYNRMLFQFWKPLDAFYPDRRFLQ